MQRYSAAGHGAMVADRARVEGYARAIERAVRPGDAVLEIGTGTGLFAVLACRAGARRVYAIETDDIVEVARANAAANGVADRIEFFHAMSTEVELPERVAVIVSDLRGVLPLYEGHLESVIDARARFLAPGGRLVPRRDRLFLALAEAPARHAELTGPWTGGALGVALPAAGELVVNDLQKASFEPGQILGAPVCWAEIDYATVESTHFSARVTLASARAGSCHGLAAWFDAELEDAVRYTTAPGAAARSTIYGNAFFPWPRALAFEAGEEAEVTMQARPVAGQYLWSWEMRHRGARYRQSTLFATPLSASRLARRAASHVPPPSDEARIDHAILGAIVAGRSLGEIASDLLARWPARFGRREDALARAGEVSGRYDGKP